MKERCVLIVDRPSVFRELLKLSFKSERLSFILTENYTSTMEMLLKGSTSYHCILLDAILAKMHDFQLYKAITKETLEKQIPLFIMVSSIEEEQFFKSINRSVAGYILKSRENVSNVTLLVKEYCKKDE